MSDEPTDGTPSNNSADKKPEELLGSGEKSQTVTDVSERQSLVERIQALEDRADTVEKKNEALRDKVESQQDTIDSQQRKIKQMEEDHSSMEESHSSLDETVERLDRTIDRLEETTTETRKTLEETTDDLREEVDRLGKKTDALGKKNDYLRGPVLGVEDEDGNVDVDTPMSERIDNVEDEIEEMSAIDSLDKPISEFSKIEIAAHFALDAVYRDAKARNGKGKGKGSVTVSTVVDILESPIVKDHTKVSIPRQTVNTAFGRARANWDGITIQSGTPGPSGKAKQLRCDLETVDQNLEKQLELFMDQLDVPRDELA